MKKLILSAVLALSSLASACPVVPGFLANGITPIPAGVTPVCGSEHTLYGGKIEPGRWVELYTVDTDDTTVARDLIRALYEEGYESTGRPKEDAARKSTIFGFVNHDTGGIVVLQVFIAGNELYLGIMGR